MQGSSVKLQCSKGLTMHYDTTAPLKSDLEIPVDTTVPFSCTRLKLRVFSQLSIKEHSVTVQCPWTTNMLTVPLSFTSPLHANFKLHTSKHRKFVQIIVSGQSSRRLQLGSVKLSTTYAFVQLKDLNPVIDAPTSVSIIFLLKHYRRYQICRSS